MDATCYKTSDTSLATFLIASGYFLRGVDYSQPRYEFSFIDSPELQQLSSTYISGKALVEPTAFTRVNKKLLRIIRSKIQWEDD